MSHRHGSVIARSSTTTALASLLLLLFVSAAWAQAVPPPGQAGICELTPVPPGIVPPGIDRTAERCSSAAGQARGDFNGDGFADLAVGVPNDLLIGVQVGAVNVIYGSADGLSATAPVAAQLWTQTALGVPEGSEDGDFFGSALASGDFNGDGFSDLAVGAKFEDVGTVPDAGSVTVILGSASGLTAAGVQYITRRGPAPSEQFGEPLAWANFGKGPQADLAVGIRFADAGSIGNAGVVEVIYGSIRGLDLATQQIWSQDSPGVPDQSELDDHWGAVVAGGDFNRDGIADLAVSAPNEDLETRAATITDAGLVNVIYGTPLGLNATSPVAAQAWTQGRFGTVADAPERADLFGNALAVANFDGAGGADLAIGVPLEDVGGVADPGAVNVLYGSIGPGLTDAGNQLLLQPEVPESGDQFGGAVAGNDLDGDGDAELAVGAASENPGGASHGGAVSVFNGSPAGLAAATGDAAFLHEGVPGVPGTALSFEHFGAALSMWNFGHGAEADLAIGVPGEGLGGAAYVLYGSTAGLDFSNSQIWSQDTPGVPGDPAAGESFGLGLY